MVQNTNLFFQFSIAIFILGILTFDPTDDGIFLINCVVFLK